MRKKVNFLKAISLGLAAIMMLAILPISVSATTTPTEVTIDEASDWDAYKGDDGIYMLNAEETYVVSATVTTITGTFDGNGATVTTSVPLFTEAKNATVKNLIINGAIDGGEATLVAAVCCTAYNTTFENITNNASVEAATNAAGIVAVGEHLKDDSDAYVTSEIKFVNCHNTGTMTVTGTSKTKVAGILATVPDNCGEKLTITATNCSNSADMEATKPAGFAAYIGDADLVSVSGFSNSGKMTGTDCTGGVIAQTSKNVKELNINDCNNDSEIKTSSKYVGGIIGIKQAQSSDDVISNCVNTGDVTSTHGSAGQVGGIGGTICGVQMKACGNSGTISGTQYTG